MADVMTVPRMKAPADYIYQQTSDDRGADAIRAALGIDTLQASVQGIGPIITYQGQLFGTPASFKTRFVTETNAGRRFEGNNLWLSATVSF